MDQLNKQNQQKDNKNEQQPIKKDEKDQKDKPFQQPKIKERMIMRMQTGKDGMDFEGIAEESQLKENFSKVLKDVLLSQ